MLTTLLKLFGCKEQSANEKKSSSKDSLSEQIAKSVQDFKNRPLYEKLTSQIFDTIKDNDIEQAVMDNMWSKMRKDLSDEYQTVLTFSKSRQSIFIIWQLEAEVNNGGFNQFYYNSSGQYADKAEEAFKTIGAIKFADLTNRANEIYKKENAKITKHLDGTMEGFSKSYDDNPLNKLDTEFFALYKTEDLFLIKIAFIRKHKVDFIDN